MRCANSDCIVNKRKGRCERVESPRERDIAGNGQGMVFRVFRTRVIVVCFLSCIALQSGRVCTD